MTLAKVLVEEESVICKLISCPVVKVTECVKSENVPAPVAESKRVRAAHRL